jgi:CBS domain-containing protein
MEERPVKITELIGTTTPLTVQDDDTVSLGLQTMLWGDIRHLPVLRDGELVGVVSERDLLAHQLRRGRQGRGDMIHTMMSRPPVVVSPDADAAYAAQLMLERRLGCLPVIKDGWLVGIVTRSDLLRAGLGAPHDRAQNQEPRVRDIMRSTLVTGAADDYLLDAVARMESHGVRHLPVVDGEHRLIGMLSDRDVRSALGFALRPFNQKDAVVRIASTRVSDVMTRKPLTIEGDAPLADAASFIADHRIGALPVVEAPGQNLVGIVSYVDILHAYGLARS